MSSTHNANLKSIVCTSRNVFLPSILAVKTPSQEMVQSIAAGHAFRKFALSSHATGVQVTDGMALLNLC